MPKFITSVNHSLNARKEVILHENNSYYKDNQISPEEHYQNTGRYYTGKNLSEDVNFIGKLNTIADNHDYSSFPNNNPLIAQHLAQGKILDEELRKQHSNYSSVNSPVRKTENYISSKTFDSLRKKSNLQIQDKEIDEFNKLNNSNVDPDYLNKKSQLDTNKFILNREKLKNKVNDVYSQNNDGIKKKNIFSENIYKGQKKSIKKKIGDR